MEPQQVGVLGEKIAADYLTRQGYRLLDKNYRKPWGEIDIVAQDVNKDIVFIEVKSRNVAQCQNKTVRFFPEDSVTYLKQSRIVKTAESYLAEAHWPADTNWRVDVIAIEMDVKKQKSDLKHIKDAIR